MQASRQVGSQDLYLKTSEGAAFAARPVPRSKTINNEITTHLKAPLRHNIHIYSSLRSPSPVLNAPNYFNSVRKTESERKREREGRGHSHKTISPPSSPSNDFFFSWQFCYISQRSGRKKKGKCNQLFMHYFSTIQYAWWGRGGCWRAEAPPPLCLIHLKQWQWPGVTIW